MGGTLGEGWGQGDQDITWAQPSSVSGPGLLIPESWVPSQSVVVTTPHSSQPPEAASEGEGAVRSTQDYTCGPLEYLGYKLKSWKLFESNLLTYKGSIFDKWFLILDVVWKDQTRKVRCVELIHRFIENDLKSIEFGVLNTA